MFRASKAVTLTILGSSLFMSSWAIDYYDRTHREDDDQQSENSTGQTHHHHYYHHSYGWNWLNFSSGSNVGSAGVRSSPARSLTSRGGFGASGSASAGT
jgi:hypothetical protein